MGIMTYIILITSPISYWIQYYLEHQYPIVTKPEKLQAGVILGGGNVRFNKNLQQFIYSSNVGRFNEAVRLLKNDKIDYLIISGGDPIKPALHLWPEAKSMNKLALEFGVPEDKIIIEKDSLDTSQQSVYLKKVFEKNNIKNFYLITSAVHMPRSIAVFKKQGLNPIAFPVSYKSSDNFSYFYKWRLTNMFLLHESLHEIFGYIYYAISGKV